MPKIIQHRRSRWILFLEDTKDGSGRNTRPDVRRAIERIKGEDVLPLTVRGVGSDHAVSLLRDQKPEMPGRAEHLYKDLISLLIENLDLFTMQIGLSRVSVKSLEPSRGHHLTDKLHTE